MLAASKGLIRPRKGVLAHDERLHFRPKAIITWWSRQAAVGHTRGNSGGLGLATASEYVAVAWASDDGADPARARRWTSDDAILGFSSASSATPALRGGIAFTDTGFTLKWHNGPSEPWLVHYLALGGDELTHAALTQFATGASGRQSVTGLGFEPDCVVLAPTCVEETSASGLLAAIGAATPKAQVGAAFASADGASPSEVRGSQRSDSVTVVPLPGGRELGCRAILRSMDPDGFSLDWQLRHVSMASMVGLALKGGRYLVGTGGSPVGSRRRQHVRVGFRPSGVLAFSWGLEASHETKDIGRLSLGAASASASGAAGWGDRNRSASPSSTQAWASEAAILEIADTRRETLHERATFLGFNRDGFVLDWTISDRTRREFAYLAFGPRPAVRRAGRQSALGRLRRLLLPIRDVRE
jgi:hypothetical protein